MLQNMCYNKATTYWVVNNVWTTEEELGAQRGRQGIFARTPPRVVRMLQALEEEARRLDALSSDEEEDDFPPPPGGNNAVFPVNESVGRPYLPS